MERSIAAEGAGVSSAAAEEESESGQRWWKWSPQPAVVSRASGHLSAAKIVPFSVMPRTTVVAVQVLLAVMFWSASMLQFAGWALFDFAGWGGPIMRAVDMTLVRNESIHRQRNCPPKSESPFSTTSG